VADKDYDFVEYDVMLTERRVLKFWRNFPHFSSGLREATALMSTDVSEVRFLQVLKKMRDVKHSYESAGSRRRFEFSP
jgi:hypothetical protein